MLVHQRVPRYISIYIPFGQRGKENATWLPPVINGQASWKWRGSEDVQVRPDAAKITTWPWKMATLWWFTYEKW